MLRCVFDPVYRPTNQNFTVKLSFEKEISPSAVTMDNFTVIDNASGDEIEVTEAVYKPLTKEVVLSVKPVYLYGLDCTVKISDEGLPAIDGSVVTKAEVKAELLPDYKGNIYDVSVDGIHLYNQNMSIPYPNENEPFLAKVYIVNPTRTKQTRTLILYKNDKESTPFFKTTVTVDAESETEKFYYIQGMSWEISDVLNAKIL